MRPEVCQPFRVASPTAFEGLSQRGAVSADFRLGELPQDGVAQPVVVRFDEQFFIIGHRPQEPLSAKISHNRGRRLGDIRRAVRDRLGHRPARDRHYLQQSPMLCRQPLDSPAKFHGQ